MGRISSDGLPSERVGGTKRRFEVVPGRSALLVEARSSTGPIGFGTLSLAGWVVVALLESVIDLSEAPCARVEVDLSSLRSGNAVYDAELLRRIDVRRFPRAAVESTGAAAIAGDGRYLLEGDVTFHGVTRRLRGAVDARVTSGGDELIVDGDQVVDVRDFGLAPPALLMLTVYPVVQVRLHLVAAAGGNGG